MTQGAWATVLLACSALALLGFAVTGVETE
jgi:hypothetical protein